MTLTSRIRRPHAAASGYNARDVAKAYGCPIDRADGTGVTVGVIELGGAYSASDLTAMGLNPANVTTVNVGYGKPKSDGPNGADGEVMLDVEVIAQVAPGSKIRVYFAANTDSGFLAAITQAVAECDLISISWGGPESSWSAASVKQFSAAFALARSHGVTVFAAAGDAGSKDGTRSDAADYPASDPNVVGCGGTRLTLNPDGSRKAEVAWNDNPTSSATGGGVSKLFPGRTVPDVAGNADPQTGYACVVDGESGVIGGTSAVAPLYAAMSAVVKQLYPHAFDFLNVLATNPTLCVDITQGSNGTYRAGPGRDDVSGYGVVAWDRLLTVLTSGTQIPAPGGTTTPPPPSQPPVQPPTRPPPATTPSALLKAIRADVDDMAAKLKAAGF